MHLDLTRIEHTFEDAAGKIRSFPGCSLGGLVAFRRRYDEIQEAIVTHLDQSLALVYLTDTRVRWLCDECLKLNGIKPKWVSGLMLQELIFNYQLESGEWAGCGRLLEINQIQQKKSSGSSEEKELTIPDAIAMVSLITKGDIVQATSLVQQMPAQDLVDLIDAIVDINKTPEERHEDEFQDWKEGAKERLDKLFGRSVEAS
jgi:hypothetical protein